MIHVLLSNIAPRVEYAFRLVFETILKCDLAFYTEKELFETVQGVKINYTKRIMSDCLNLQPDGFLAETGIEEKHLEIFTWDDLPVFFKVDNSFLPFDIFSASFFLVSRYEEYLSRSHDVHGRFESEDSFASENNFLDKPLVNIWAIKMAEIISASQPSFAYSKPTFTYMPSIDVDNAWAYRNKGLARNCFSCMRNFMAGRFKQITERFAVLAHFKQDPYDTYSLLLELNMKYGFRPIFFFLLNKKGKYDRSVSWYNPNFKKLIRRIGEDCKVGIHPSYQSNFKTGQLAKEVLHLQNILNRVVKGSRQHYLMMHLPSTYQQLIENNIEADFSMGYADQIGFRASIATPFKFFDLQRNETTNLKVYPFQVMDATLRRYCHLSVDEAWERIENLMEETAKCGGTFISLWHNESLRNSGDWEGWNEVYEKMTEKAAKLYDGYSTVKK